MNNNLFVTKRNGEKESIDLEKIHKVVTWAAKGLKNVSVSQVEIKAQIQFYDGINTSEIHETLIKSAADLISTDAPDYQYMAARLLHLLSAYVFVLYFEHQLSKALNLIETVAYKSNK